MIKIKRRKLHPAEQYVSDILNGRIVSCNLVKKACLRYLQDKKNTKKKGLYFCKKSAQKAIDFFHIFLKHSKGKWAGEPFILEPWQQFIVWNIFGWKIGNKNGPRRFRIIYLEISRKNGKSTFLAGIGLYCFICDKEAGAECYAAATKEKQAKIVHGEAIRMVKKSPNLKKKVQIFRNNLSIDETDSKFEPLGRDSDTQDGLNVHCSIIDELHAHKTRDMWDVLETATGSREQPLQIAITTAGFERTSICYEQHEYLEKILKDVGSENPYDDDTYFGMIYTIDENDDWSDEKVWIKANPNLNVSIYIDDLQRKAKKAKEIVSAVNNFLRKHLDVWVNQFSRFVDMNLWNENFANNIDERKYYGKQCYGGLDLSSVSDITAFVLLFPDINDDERLDIIARFWCPESRLTSKDNRYRNFYEAWEREGWLKTTPGDAIDYEYVKKQIIKDAGKFNLANMGVDRLFQGYQLSMELSSELGTRLIKGQKQDRVVAVGMGYKTMAPAMREFESRLLKRKLNHGNHPILRWMADNLAVSEDAAGNKKPDKANSQGKIDGIVSLLIAIDRLQREESYSGSIYEKKGLKVV